MMIFAATPHVIACKRRSTAESHKKMAGITCLPSMTLCCRCGKRRTTATGKFKKSGAFVCHSCGKGCK